MKIRVFFMLPFHSIHSCFTSPLPLIYFLPHPTLFYLYTCFTPSQSVLSSASLTFPLLKIPLITKNFFSSPRYISYTLNLPSLILSNSSNTVKFPPIMICPSLHYYYYIINISYINIIIIT